MPGAAGGRRATLLAVRRRVRPEHRGAQDARRNDRLSASEPRPWAGPTCGRLAVVQRDGTLALHRLTSSPTRSLRNGRRTDPPHDPIHGPGSRGRDPSLPQIIGEIQVLWPALTAAVVRSCWRVTDGARLRTRERRPMMPFGARRRRLTPFSLLAPGTVSRPTPRPPPVM